MFVQVELPKISRICRYLLDELRVRDNQHRFIPDIRKISILVRISRNEILRKTMTIAIFLNIVFLNSLNTGEWCHECFQ